MTAESNDVYSRLVDVIEPDDETNDPIWVASTGLVLRLRPVPASVFAKLGEVFRPPEAPLIPAEEEGKFYQNEADPDYLVALSVYRSKASDLSVQLLLVNGTEIARLPRGMPGPEETSWSEALTDPELLGDYVMDIPKHGKARYVAWLRMSSAMRNEDLPVLLKAIQRNSATVLEEDVEEAARSFPGDEGNGAAAGDPASEAVVEE